jgi:glycosyltransferase involved in cell wall biosynthesis
MIGDAISSHVPTARPIRVCFVIDRLSRAGTENQLLLMIKQLDRDRITPYLCLLDGDDPMTRELLPEKCPVLQLGVRRLLSVGALRQAFEFWQFLRREKINVVQTYFPDSTRFAAPIAKVAGVNAVFGSRRNIGHWMTPRDVRIARFYNRFFIDRIVANSKAARESVIEQEGIGPDRVVVVPNGIDLNRFKHIPPWQPKPSGVPRKIGMVGNLREVKGPDLFIRAASLVLKDHPETQFEIAGAGDPTHYQQLINELGITNSVCLRGPVSDVPSFLSTLDVAVLPSRAEGLSNALMEYMAAGRPIVATDVGGNGELICSGENGVLVDVSAASLAIGISDMLNRPNIAASLSKSSVNTMQDRGMRSSLAVMASLYERSTT